MKLIILSGMYNHVHIVNLYVWHRLNTRCSAYTSAIISLLKHDATAVKLICTRIVGSRSTLYKRSHCSYANQSVFCE